MDAKSLKNDRKLAAVRQFSSRAVYLYDSDYGDFKRKMDEALTQLWQVLGHESKEVDNLIYEYKKKLLFTGDQPIEEARTQSLQMVQRLEAIFS